MSMWKLAFKNFKESLKNYLSLMVSLAFTVLIFLNFQNVIDSGILDGLGKTNRENAEFVIQAVTFVLICFMLFFIWYSTSVFLTKKKKEIGIYAFMGLTNQKIGKLYMIETSMTGLLSLALGLGVGTLTARLFQMIMMKLSDITVEVFNSISLKSILTVSACYVVIYVIFAVKGYVNIVRSSVLEMISASRKNEYVRQHPVILLVKTVLGVAALSTGYYLAIVKGGMEVFRNTLSAVVFVTIGVYLVFGGLIPIIFQGITKRKSFLYKKQRTLWVNNIVFRMKRNYRTYAIVSVLMLCSVTALAAGFAMKERYDGMVHFRNTYTYQVLSTSAGKYKEFEKLIQKDNDIVYGTEVSMIQLEQSEIKARWKSTGYAVLSYSKVKEAAKEANLKFNLKEPKDDEYINVDKLVLLSLITDRKEDAIEIHDKIYECADVTTEPYLGYLQEMTEFYLVNDHEYESLKNIGEEVYVYNYRIKDVKNFEASVAALQGSADCAGLIKIDPDDQEASWIQIIYSVCIFMFMVFILASGSIIFVKIYNDAFEERERYAILNKIGVGSRTVKKEIACELRFAYLSPFLVMAISSYFSVKALGNMMRTELLEINILSVVIIGIFFLICYLFSVSVYMKNIKMK